MTCELWLHIQLKYMSPGLRFSANWPYQRYGDVVLILIKRLPILTVGMSLTGLKENQGKLFNLLSFYIKSIYMVTQSTRTLGDDPYTWDLSAIIFTGIDGSFFIDPCSWSLTWWNGHDTSKGKGLSLSGSGFLHVIQASYHFY